MPQNDSQPLLASVNLTSILGYLGSLPFTLLALVMIKGYLMGAGLQSASVAGLYAPYVFIAYSAVILSFLCGTLWSTARTEAEASGLSNAVIILSNLLALAAWASLLMIYLAPIMTIFAVTLLLAGFLTVLWAERMAGQHVGAYWMMRLRVTAVVVVWHVVIIFMMIWEL